MYGQGLFRVPELSVPRPLTAGEGTARLDRGFAAAGVEGGFGLVLDDRWLFPLFALGVAHAVGTYPSVATHVDGAATWLRPASAFRVELLLPGVGYRVKHRRWAASAVARIGVSAVVMDARIADQGQRLDALASAASLSVRVDLSACRRFGPLERLCLVGSPHVYDFGPMNGLTVGLRWEMGP